MSINVVVLAGNLTRDPELKITPSGTSVLEVSLAVNDRVQDRSSGEWTDRVNYFDIVVWGKRADALSEILARGDKVTVHGRLRWSSWENELGEKRSRVTVTAEQVELMQRRDRPAAAPSAPAPARHEEEDDDIPFDRCPAGVGRAQDRAATHLQLRRLPQVSAPGVHAWLVRQDRALVSQPREAQGLRERSVPRRSCVSKAA